METLWPSVTSAMILASTFVLEARLGGTRYDRIWIRRRWISAAAGASVAYVLLEILPELAALQRVTVNSDGNLGLLPGERSVYFLTLLSFLVLYGLDHLVESARTRQTGYGDVTNPSVERLYLGGLAVYCFLIGCLLPERSTRGWLALGTYLLAMALQALIIGHSAGEERGFSNHPRRRWLLVLSVVAGWVLGVMTDMSERVFGSAIAVLAGGVMQTSLKAELRDEPLGRLWPFCGGAAFFALVVLCSEAVQTW